MTFKIVIGLVVLTYYFIYRYIKLKPIKDERKRSGSKLIKLSAGDWIDTMVSISFLTTLLKVMSQDSNVITLKLIIIFLVALNLKVTMNNIKYKLSYTVSLREDGLVLFSNGENIINFNTIDGVEVIAENQYVDIINLHLKSGEYYKVSGRDKYEINKLVRAIKEKIN